MDNLIDLRIELDEASIKRDPFFLRNLERDIQREVQNQILHEASMTPEGTMSGEIINAIDVIGLTVTALGTIWTILQIRYRNEISVEKELADGTKIIVTTTYLTDKQLEREIAKHEKEAKEKRLRKFIIKLGGK